MRWKIKLFGTGKTTVPVYVNGVLGQYRIWCEIDLLMFFVS